MKRMIFWCCIGALCARVSADLVELQDGTRVEGKILSENNDSIEIQIGTNDRGTIRRVLIIDSSEIRTWVVDKQGQKPEDQAPVSIQGSGPKYVERLIQEAGQKIDSEKVDEGIREYGEAAEIAGKNIENLSPADQAALLELKAYAYRLQLAALEGKKNMLEEGMDGVEDKLEEMQEDLEKEIRDFQSDKEDFMDDVYGGDRKRIGSRQVQAELDEREKILKQRQAEFIALRDKTMTRVQEMKRDGVQTDMFIELTEERVDQAEDDAKRAARLLKR